MGVYINPHDLTTTYKTAWFEERVRAGEIRAADAATLRAHVPGKDGYFGLGLVQAGPWDAIGIAFDQGEAEAFTNPEDTRPQRYGIAHIDLIARWDPRAAVTAVQLYNKRHPEAPLDVQIA